MVSISFLNALKIVNDKFRKHDINLVLVGSLSLALQGIEIEPNDIDVLTSKEGALMCNSILKEFVVKPVKWSQTEKYDSYFGRFRIEGVQVDIMGEFKVKEGDKWVDLTTRLKKPKYVQIRSLKIPVSPLDEQLKSYEKRIWNEYYESDFEEFPVEPFIEEIVEIFNKYKVKKILDLGCGAGKYLIYLAVRNFNVYGIDISEKAINLSNSLLKERNLNAHLTVGSLFENLPYDSDFFGGSISIRSFNHATLDDIRKGIKELERVLRPGGFLFLTVRERKAKKKVHRFKRIAPRTIVPVEGNEKGIVHFLFSARILRKEFKNFDIYFLKNVRGPKDWESYYHFLGRLKK